jgi:hypothetical protein
MTSLKARVACFAKYCAVNIKPGILPTAVAFITALSSNVVHAATLTYDNTPYYFGSTLGGMSAEITSTVGQTIIAPNGENVRLKDFAFYVDTYGATDLVVRPFVFAWSGQVKGAGGGAVGDPLYLGAPLRVPPATGWRPLKAAIGIEGLLLNSGEPYVIGFTMSYPAESAASWGNGGLVFEILTGVVLPAGLDLGGGAVWMNNSNNFAALNTVVWDTWGYVGPLTFNVRFTTGPSISPGVNCSGPIELVCSNGGAAATFQAQLLDSNGYDLEAVWSVDGTSMQTNGVVSGGSQTGTNVEFTASIGAGSHTVAVSVSNGQTEPVICSTSVVVRDTAPPEVSHVEAVPRILWPPNKRMVPVTVVVDANDRCSGLTSARIVRVTSDEPVGRSGPDWRITAPLTVELRAWRLGRSGGRRYTIYVEVNDASDNRTIASTVVFVGPSQGHARHVVSQRRR